MLSNVCDIHADLCMFGTPWRIAHCPSSFSLNTCCEGSSQYCMRSGRRHTFLQGLGDAGRPFTERAKHHPLELCDKIAHALQTHFDLHPPTPTRPCAQRCVACSSAFFCATRVVLTPNPRSTNARCHSSQMMSIIALAKKKSLGKIKRTGLAELLPNLFEKAHS